MPLIKTRPWSAYSPDEKRVWIAVTIVGFVVVLAVGIAVAKLTEERIENQYNWPRPPGVVDPSQMKLSGGQPGFDPSQMKFPFGQPAYNGNSTTGGANRAPAAPGAGRPAFIIYQQQDPHLGMPCLSMLIPAGWQVSGSVDWSGPPTQPVNIRIVAKGPNGASVTVLPTTVPIPDFAGGNPWDCIVSHPNEMPALVARKSGFTEATSGNVKLVATPLRMGGLTIDDYSVMASGKIGQNDARAIAHIRTAPVPGAPILPCSTTPVVISAPPGTFNRELPRMFASATSIRVNPQWYTKYLQITLPTAQGISDMVARQQQVYEKTAQMWDDTIRGVSNYTIDGYTYKLPYANRYWHNGGNTVFVTGLDTVLDSNTPEVLPDPD